MIDDEPPMLQREGLILFGHYCAGLSHEISNVFNIINELAGLELDIVEAAAGGGGAVARVVDLAGRIKAQVARGEELNRLLHKLSHRIDSARADFDLGDLLALLGGLEARAARLARVELVVTPPRDPVTLSGDPFALLLALDACLTGALKTAADGRKLEVFAEAGDRETRIVVSSADPMEDPSATPALRLGAAAWRATTTVESESGTPHRVVLRLPLDGRDDGPRPAGPSREEP